MPWLAAAAGVASDTCGRIPPVLYFVLSAQLMQLLLTIVVMVTEGFSADKTKIYIFIGFCVE